MRGLVVERTALDASGRVVGTGETQLLEVELVLRAIGYRAVRLPGVPFDETLGVIPSEHGRVLDGDQPTPGEYVVGWIKRGPIGVIGTNKSDARETVERVLADLDGTGPRSDRVDLLEIYADWQRIEAAEANRGASHARERMKLELWHELLDLVQAERPGGPIPPH